MQVYTSTLSSSVTRNDVLAYGGSAPEYVTVAGPTLCSLDNSVTLCDTAAAGAPIEISLPDVEPSASGFVKTIFLIAGPYEVVITGVTDPALTTTLGEPGQGVSYLWAGSEWVV